MTRSKKRDDRRSGPAAKRSRAKTFSVKCGKNKIEFRLRRSDRRTLAISVMPDASVVVTAPAYVDSETVFLRVERRASWIVRQKGLFEEFLPPVPPRKFVSGETHRYLGRQYRLKLIESETPNVTLSGRFIWVHLPTRSDTKHARELVEGWFLKRAKERLFQSFEKGIARLGARFATQPKMKLRKMSKRWGSWTQRGIVYLNPELIKAPSSCVDYVVTHELCHTVHGNHGKHFYELLQRVMPDWRARKTRLERLMSD